MFRSSSKFTSLNKETNLKVPSLLVKEGYITKLKSKKRRYFVLYTENEPAHLDYYENEKKFKISPNSFKRSILLKDCFAVIKKNDPRFKKNNIFVFAIYTQDDCFSLMFDNQDEMNDWFSLINEVHLKALAKNKSVIHDYDKIWYAVIKDKKSKIKGSFYFCLTSEEIHLYKIKDIKEKKFISSSEKSSNNQVNLQPQSSTNSSLPNKTTNSLTTFYNKLENGLEILRFPFSLIRSFGHQSNCLFIHLGRSSDIGSCQLWFEVKDCDTPQYIHSLVASTRTAAKNNEFRTRSNSENNRMFSRRNKSLNEKQNSSASTSNSRLSSNSKLSNNSNHKLISSSDNNKLIKNEKENLTEEYVPSPSISYTAVAYTLENNNQPIRSRSTSESSTCYKTKLLLNFQSSNQITSWPNNKIVSSDSMNSNNDEEKDSDYYMTTPNQGNDVQQSLTPSYTIKEEDYLLVEDEISVPLNDRTFSNASTVQINKLESIKSSDLKLVPTSSLAAKLTAAASSSTINHAVTIPNSFLIDNAQHYKQIHSQYSSPVNNSFIELPDPVEELNDDQVDEYIQVELGSEKPSLNDNYKKQDNRLEAINSEISTSDNKKSTSQQISNDYEEDDYIGIESFSSTNTATNPETGNFEISNLSPISSTSCSINRVKTFSTSSNNTSNNELSSLGSSLLSNPAAFYNTTPINHVKEEVFKLDKVKSYFNSTEDCDDYIKPARTYSMGSRPQLANHHKLTKHPHCQSMTKSNTLSNTNSLIMNNQLNKYLTKKVKCGHLIANNEQHICNHPPQAMDESFLLKDNRVRAYSMGSHLTIQKDLLRKIRLNHLSQQNKTRKNSRQSSVTIEDEETSEKCLSTPILVEDKDKDNTRNCSATFANSSSASTSSKKTVNEESSSEDDLMDIDLSISKSVPRFENEFNYNHNPISIKEKFKELSLDSNELKSTDETKEN